MANGKRSCGGVARQARTEPQPRLIDPRNRVSLTPEVMEALAVRPGNYIAFRISERGIVELYKLEWSLKEPGGSVRGDAQPDAKKSGRAR